MSLILGTAAIPGIAPPPPSPGGISTPGLLPYELPELEELEELEDEEEEKDELEDLELLELEELEKNELPELMLPEPPEPPLKEPEELEEEDKLEPEDEPLKLWLKEDWLGFDIEPDPIKAVGLGLDGENPVKLALAGVGRPRTLALAASGIPFTMFGLGFPAASDIDCTSNKYFSLPAWSGTIPDGATAKVWSFELICDWGVKALMPATLSPAYEDWYCPNGPMAGGSLRPGFITVISNFTLLNVNSNFSAVCG